jgi:acyl-CoA reductase-like NAD-dependent aldehyde dehydrogenase
VRLRYRRTADVKYAERVRTYVLGEPSDPNTTMGPVVSKRSADSIRRQVADASQWLRLCSVIRGCC